jgi:hypothetical protein
VLRLYFLAAVLLGFLAAVGIAVMLVVDITGVPRWVAPAGAIAAGIALGAFAWWRGW